MISITIVSVGMPYVFVSKDYSKPTSRGSLDIQNLRILTNLSDPTCVIPHSCNQHICRLRTRCFHFTYLRSVFGAFIPLACPIIFDSRAGMGEYDSCCKLCYDGNNILDVFEECCALWTKMPVP